MGFWDFLLTLLCFLFLKRYGSIFKSHILGCPTIVCMDPEVNRYVLMNESKGLVPGYPQSMLDILGKCNIAAVHGSAHKLMRAALLSVVSPTMIKDRLLPKVDEFMRSHLRNWDRQIIDIQDKTKEVNYMKRMQICYFVPMMLLLLPLFSLIFPRLPLQMALCSSLKQIAGIESGPLSESFIPEFFKLVLGTLSLPIDFPGTNYRQGIQVKRCFVFEFQ